MARNKNSTALFDVIHAAKKPPKASPSANMPTPRWWGKDKQPIKKVPQPTAAASTENVGKQKSWLSAAKKSVVAPAAAPAAAVAPVVQAESAEMPVAEDHRSTESVPVETSAPTGSEAKPKTRFIDRFVNRPLPSVEVAAEPVALVAEPVASTPVVERFTEQSTEKSFEQPSEATAWTDSEFVQITPAARPTPKSKPSVDYEPAFKVDPGRKEFLFRLSYGGIIAIGFIFVLALGIAFLAGKRTAIETADLDSQPTTRGAVAATGTATGTGMLAAVAPPKSDSDIQASNTVLNIDQHHNRPDQFRPDQFRPNQFRPAITLNNPTPAASPLPIQATRKIGLNYVIIQSYDQQELAQKACDFVNQGNQPDMKCTVVQGPSEWAPHDWYSVIGLKPYTKGDPALEDYKRTVRAIGLKFSNKPLNQFDPKAYTWRADSDMGQP